jgi:NitT/TauT family transport system ATP-binding protein/bicarbonate transport system ATP-binding protein
VIAPGASARLFLHRYQQLNPGSVLADAVLVPVVAGQLIDFFRDGMFDGFCGIDPLPRLAALRPDVVCLANSADLFPMHPGGVTTLRTDVVERNPDIVAGWVRALSRGCEECAKPAQQADVWRLVLSQGVFPEVDTASRVGLSKALGESPSGDLSIRYSNTDKPRKGAKPTDPEAFIDAVCRSALGASLRGLDMKAEIARVYLLKAQKAAVEV